MPNAGSGYARELGWSNSDNWLKWPLGSPDAPPAPFDVSNAHVFCGLGADWFSETRAVRSLDFAARTIHFAGASNGIGGCNHKAFLQGPKELIDEPGEWALEPAAGLLYYWPHDAAALAPGSAEPPVALTAAAAVSFEGEAPPGAPVPAPCRSDPRARRPPRTASVCACSCVG